MKKFIVLSLSVLLSMLLTCKNENVTGPPPIKTDNTFADIDTTLKIQTTQEGDLTIYKIDRYNTVVVKIPRISSYIYMKRPAKSLEEIAKDSSFNLVVNASYFDVFYDDTAAHTGVNFKNAGFLKINNTIYENIKDDRQLTRLLAYNSKTNIVDYFNINDLDKTKDYDLVVQIGPQLIRDNEIDTTSILTSFNGYLAWPRTAFASVDGKEFYIIVNLNFTWVTLLNLAKMLRSSGIFKKQLNIINFDGGFSTCLYIKNHPEFSTNPGNKMPFLIGVR